MDYATEPKVIGWCHYCHFSILEGDSYTVEDEKRYHPECFQQMTTYYDPLEFCGDDVDE